MLRFGINVLNARWAVGLDVSCTAGDKIEKEWSIINGELEGTPFRAEGLKGIASINLRS